MSTSILFRQHQVKGTRTLLTIVCASQLLILTSKPQGWRRLTLKIRKVVLKSENSIYRDGAVSYFQLDSVSSFGRFVTIARRGPTLQPSLSKQYQDFLFVWKSHSDKFQHVWRTLLTFCERLCVFRVKHLKSVVDETHQPLCISDGEGANMDPVTEHMSVSSWVGEFVSSYEVNVSVREKKRSRDRMSAHKPYYSLATIKVNKNY